MRRGLGNGIRRNGVRNRANINDAGSIPNFHVGMDCLRPLFRKQVPPPLNWVKSESVWTHRLVPCFQAKSIWTNAPESLSKSFPPDWHWSMDGSSQGGPGGYRRDSVAFTRLRGQLSSVPKLFWNWFVFDFWEAKITLWRQTVTPPKAQVARSYGTEITQIPCKNDGAQK